MAIEISSRAKIKAPIWTLVVGVVLVILLIALIAAYFYLAFSLKKISEELEENNIVVIPLEKDIKGKEAELEPISQKIDDFGKLLVGHKKTLDVFTFLERICLPTIWFSSFGFDSKSGEVSIFGQADNFATLEQQINILRQESALKSSDIIEILINEEGKIDFSLSLFFR